MAMKEVVRENGKVTITYPNDSTVREDLRGKSVTYYDVPGTAYEVRSEPRPAGVPETPIYSQGNLIVPTPGGYLGYSVGSAEGAGQILNPTKPPIAERDTTPITLPSYGALPVPMTKAAQGTALNLSPAAVSVPGQTKEQIYFEMLSRPVTPESSRIRLGGAPSSGLPPMILGQASYSTQYESYLSEQRAIGEANMLTARSGALAESLIGKPEEYEDVNPLGAALGAGMTYAFTLPGSMIESPVFLTEAVRTASAPGGVASLLDTRTAAIREHPITGGVTLALDVGMIAAGGYSIIKGMGGARTVSTTVRASEMIEAKSYLEQRVFTADRSDRFMGGGAGGFAVKEPGKVTYYDVEAVGSGKVTGASEAAVSGESQALLEARKTAEVTFNRKTGAYDYREFKPGESVIQAGAESKFSVAKNAEAAKGYALERYTTASGGTSYAKVGETAIKEEFITTGQAAKMAELINTKKMGETMDIGSRSAYAEIGDAQSLTGKIEMGGATDLISVRRPSEGKPLPFVPAPQERGPMKPFAYQESRAEAGMAVGERISVNKALETSIRAAGTEGKAPGAGTSLGVRDIAPLAIPSVSSQGADAASFTGTRRRSGFDMETEYYAYPPGRTPRDVVNIGSGAMVNARNMDLGTGSGVGFGVSSRSGSMMSSQLDLGKSNILGKGTDIVTRESQLFRLDTGTNIVTRESQLFRLDTGTTMSFRQKQRQGSMTGLSYSYRTPFQTPLSPMPPITPGGGFLLPPPPPGLIEYRQKRKDDTGLKSFMRYGYLPSLTGIESGFSISKRPSMVGGFEVRFPVRR